MPKALTNRGTTEAVEDVTKGVGQVNLRRNKAVSFVSLKRDSIWPHFVSSSVSSVASGN